MKHFDDIRVNIKVGTGRRVGHSFLTALRSIGPSSKSTHIARALANDANVVSAMGIGVGAAQMTGTIAESAAVAGFVAAIAGPQIAITAGIVGIALIAYSAYTNREDAHEELFGYCWNIITPTRPTKTFGAVPDLCKAAAAGMRLIEEGAKQMAEQCNKLEKTTLAFAKFNEDIALKIRLVESAATNFTAAHQAYQKERGDSDRVMITIRDTKGVKDFAPITVGPAYNRLEDCRRRFDEAKKRVLNEFNAAAEVDGAIFEMVRRCQHYSEYLQAPHIVSMYYKSQVNNELSSEAKNFGVEDFFKDWPTMVRQRDLFKKADEVYGQFSALTLYEEQSFEKFMLF